MHARALPEESSFRTDRAADGISNGVRAVPQAELHKDVADVMPDSLSTDEGAFGDLGIRESQGD